MIVKITSNVRSTMISMNLVRVTSMVDRIGKWFQILCKPMNPNYFLIFLLITCKSLSFILILDLPIVALSFWLILVLLFDFILNC